MSFVITYHYYGNGNVLLREGYMGYKVRILNLIKLTSPSPLQILCSAATLENVLHESINLLPHSGGVRYGSTILPSVISIMFRLHITFPQNVYLHLFFDKNICAS